MARVHLVDALPYVFRAYYSLPVSMTAPDGMPVNAVRGFASFLARLFAEEKPTHLAVAFDESLTTSFRNEIYPDYKSGRELPPPELVAQLDACQELTVACGAVKFSSDRYEADDLIGTLCTRFAGEGHEVVVVSPDKDLAQLVSERVEQLDFAKGVRRGPAEVKETMGVTPKQVPDFLGLAGDAVDAIPGVKGVGAKTAVALLAEFADLEEIYRRLDEVPTLAIRGAASVKKKLEAGRELAFLSRRLATLAMDAPAPGDLASLRFRGADREKLEPLLDRLGMTGFGRRLP